MRAVRCVDGRATVVEVPTPSGEGVRISMVSSGICGSDLVIEPATMRLINAGLSLALDLSTTG